MIELSKENFEQEVLQASGIVFVDFWSPQCEPCIALFPEVEAFAERNAGSAKFCKLDTAGNKRLAISQKVLGLPTYIFYKDGAPACVFGKDDINIPALQAKLDELKGA
ncbi:MAG: thioredoxin [Christensenellaceae bacterium]|jgi:thioredoxin 1|nr:thioredoxin [Christensenellaceae bacterium]